MALPTDFARVFESWLNIVATAAAPEKWAKRAVWHYSPERKSRRKPAWLRALRPKSGWELSNLVAPRKAQKRRKQDAVKPLIGTRWVQLPPGKGWPPAGSESCVVVSDGGTKRRQQVLKPCD